LKDKLYKYLRAFQQLKRGGTKYGPAPHKPVLLLSVLQAIQNGVILENKIYLSPELISIFKSNWSKLVKTSHVCTIALPFFHLHKEKSSIWFIIPRPGMEAVLKIKESISSISEINHMIEYASLSQDLFLLMLDPISNQSLQQALIDKYFPNENYKPQANLFSELEEIKEKILSESPEEYKNEIIHLIKEKNEEEIFLRGSLFKREIPKIYNNTCSISGMRIQASSNISMIDACHIVPFSESNDDTISNGIALCPNLHRAFDRGLISISDEYRVIINKNFIESESSYNLQQFRNKEIILPASVSHHPSPENLRKHRERFGIN
jgi:putative restriction endonuclease